MSEEVYYTPPQAARVLKLSRRRVTQMLNDGQLEGARSEENGRWKIPAAAVTALLKERSERPAPQRSMPVSRRVEELTERMTLLEGRVGHLADSLNRALNRFERTEQELRDRIRALEQESSRRR